MTNDNALSRSLLIMAVCVPLALFLGYAIATPATLKNLTLVGLVFLVITFPLWLKWHHGLLIASWNSTLVAFFLPGEQPLWVAMAGLSLFIAIASRTLTKSSSFISVPSVSRPLIFLAIVMVVTALFTGGIGGRSFGSEEWGARRYFASFGAIVGFFALVAVRIPPQRALFLTSLFFLSTAVSVMSDLIYYLGPKFYSLYLIFDPVLAMQQAFTRGTLDRFTGLCWSANAIMFYMILRYKISGLLDLSKPLRLIFFLLLFPLSLMGGFRSTVVVFGLVFVIQFYFEGLLRTALFPILIIVGLAGVIFVAVFAERLPLSVQRSISILPVKIDPEASRDAESTTDWRLTMWQVLLPEVPKYLLLGKGYTYSGVDYYLTQEAAQEGRIAAYEPTLISGNYHNGWFTILIPFGIGGLIGFFWFIWAALKVLYANYKFGQESMRQINTFLLAYFLARLVFYLSIYGQFDLDLCLFTGLVGLSVSLNGGICQPAQPSPIPVRATEMFSALGNRSASLP